MEVVDCSPPSFGGDRLNRADLAGRRPVPRRRIQTTPPQSLSFASCFPSLVETIDAQAEEAEEAAQRPEPFAYTIRSQPIESVLDAAAKDPEIMKTLKETAVTAEREMITPFLQWRYNGRGAGNGWSSPINNAQWGTDYLNRTGTAKSNMYDNRPVETKYIYTDDDSQGKQLEGRNSYAITFAKGEVPPVNGFWSLTLYDSEHFFNPNPLNRYSLGTKNKTLKYNPDGSLTYAPAQTRLVRIKRPTGYLRRTAISRSFSARTGRTK